MGTHMVNVHNSLYKKSITRSGTIVSNEHVDDEFNTKKEFEDAIEN